MCGLFGQLLALDDGLDVFLVLPARIVVAPPHGPLVLALETEMFACSAHGRSLIALLPP